MIQNRSTRYPLSLSLVVVILLIFYLTRSISWNGIQENSFFRPCSVSPVVCTNLSSFFISVYAGGLQFASGLLSLLYRILLFNPLKFIYLHGPFLGGYGFWNGVEPSDICAQLSKGVPARFWLDNIDQCEEQIDKQIVAMCISVWIIVFIAACYFVLQIGMWHYYQRLVLRPVLVELWHSTSQKFANPRETKGLRNHEEYMKFPSINKRY